MRKKLLVLILSIVLILPFINFNNIGASINDYNRSIIVDSYTNFSTINTDTTTLSMSSGGQIIQVDINNTTLIGPTSNIYSGGYVLYNLYASHIYYVGVLEDSANTGSIASNLGIRHSDNTNSFVDESSYTGDLNEYLFTSTAGLLSNIYFITSSAGTVSIDKLVIIDVTLSYGVGNEPDLATLRSLDIFNSYVTAVDYFNIVDPVDTIGLLKADRTLDNLINNGGFSNGTVGWSFVNASGYYLTNDMFNLETTTTKYITADPFIPLIANNYYYSSIYINVLRYVSGSIGIRIDSSPSFVRVIRNSLGSSTETNIHLQDSNKTNLGLIGGFDGANADFKLDNILLLNLSPIYSKGNIPTVLEMDQILIDNNAPEYFDSFTYVDNVYFEMENRSNFFQYYNNLDGDNAVVDFTLTETLIQNSTTPLIYITKSDLNGNYIGDLVTTSIPLTGQNIDGFNYYDYTYNLPSPTINEDGYTYTVYNGVGGKILSAGYVYKQVSTGFTTTLSGVRDGFYGVGINDSVYLDLASSYQFDETNPDDYIFNANRDMVLHYRANRTLVETNSIELVMTLENNNNELIMNLNTHYLFNPYDDGLRVEGYYIMSYDGSPPTFIETLNTTNIFNPDLEDFYTDYVTNLTEVLDQGALPDFTGFYTYYIRYDNGASFETKAKGETPIYAVANSPLYAISVFNANVRVGADVKVIIDKTSSLVDDIYDYQYIFDTNSGSTYTDGLDIYNTRTDILYEVIAGFTAESSIIYYNVTNTDVYKNGSTASVYDIKLTSGYNITVPLSIEETINNNLDDMGLGGVVAKSFLVFILLVVLSVIFLFIKLPLISIAIIDISIMALFVIIGFIPLWIPLLLLLILLGIAFLVFRN